MKIPNFDDYEDTELQDLATAAAVEQQRRADLDRIPQLMADQAKLYSDGGGDIQDLITAITPETSASE